jgi:hypothetical protein
VRAASPAAQRKNGASGRAAGWQAREALGEAEAEAPAGSAGVAA